jgi:hypothetical protein
MMGFNKVRSSLARKFKNQIKVAHSNKHTSLADYDAKLITVIKVLLYWYHGDCTFKVLDYPLPYSYPCPSLAPNLTPTLDPYFT